MALYKLENDEGVVLQSATAMLGGASEEEFENEELMELVVTNKRIIYVVEISTGFFSKAKTEVRQVPISSIKVINGVPQVKQVNHDMWGHSVQVQFVHGIEYWTLEKKKIPEWVSEISRLLNEELKQVSRASYEKPAARIESPVAVETEEPVLIVKTEEQPTATNEQPVMDKNKHIYCSNCGEKLVVGSKFCNACGTPTGTTEQNKEEPTAELVTAAFTQPTVEEAVVEPTTERKIVYEGELHKCPNCGELLESFVANCPSCGHELRGIKNSPTLTTFISKLETATSEKQQISIIRNQSIPNTKEDVIEFMLLVINNISGTNSSDIRKAWQAKLEQVYQKANLLLSKSDLVQFNSLYEETTKKMRTHDIAQQTKGTGKAVLRLSKTVLGFVVKNAFSILCIVLYLKAIQIDRLGENGVGYELLGGVLAITSALLIQRKNVNYFEILFLGCCGGLHFYLANFLNNGAGLQLLGAVTLALVFIAFIKKVIRSN